MTQETKKIKVKYNATTTKVEGYYPSSIKYPNNVIDEEAKTIDGSPYIEVAQEEHEAALGKEMAVVDGSFVEYIMPNDEALVFYLNSNTSAVKSEARTRILDLYSEHDQRNILMSGDALNISDMNAAITAIRNKSNELESSLSSMTLEELIAFDPSNDNNWE